MGCGDSKDNKAKSEYLYHEEGTGKVYLEIDGQLRHVMGPDQFGRLFNQELKAEDMKQFKEGEHPMPIGDPLHESVKLVQEGEDIFMLNTVEDKPMKHNVWPDAFTKYNFDAATVQNVEWDAIKDICDGAPIMDSPNGAATEETNPNLYHVRPSEDVENGDVYVNFGGNLRHVASPEAFNRIFAGALDAKRMEQVVGEPAFAITQPIPDDARLVRVGEDGPTFLVLTQVGGLTKRKVCESYAKKANFKPAEKVEGESETKRRIYPDIEDSDFSKSPIADWFKKMNPKAEEEKKETTEDKPADEANNNDSEEKKDEKPEENQGEDKPAEENQGEDKPAEDAEKPQDE